MLSSTQDSVCCSRCGQALPGSTVPTVDETLAESSVPLPCPADSDPQDRVASDAANTAATLRSPALPRPALADWDFEEDLRHIERLLRRDRPRTETSAWHAEPPRTSWRSSSNSTGEPTRSTLTPLLAAIAWLIICAGLAATVCGLVLLCWTWFGGRAELLIPGLACAAAGQFGLLGGLLIQPAQRPSTAASDDADSNPWLDLHRRIDDILRVDLPE